MPEPVPPEDPRAERARRRAAERRDPVSRSAEATAAVLALAALLVGVLGRAIAFGSPALGAAFAGLIVAGIGLELYARAIGGWAARDETPWCIGCVLVGSPVVLAHALLHRRGPLAPEPGALAGLLVPVAFVVFIWALASG